jgi:hypothetical protein
MAGVAGNGGMGETVSASGRPTLSVVSGGGKTLSELKLPPPEYYWNDSQQREDEWESISTAHHEPHHINII